MIIRNFKEQNIALSQISFWLEKGVFSEKVFGEIKSVILAVESYMGMPLPAKKFIVSNCQIKA